MVNILFFPGLGSLRSGRRLAGLGQVLFSIGGFTLVLVWLFKMLSQYYALMFEEVKPQSVGWIGVTGGVLFAVSWLWSAATSISLFRQADKLSFAPPILRSTSNLGNTEGNLAAAPNWTRAGEIISRTFEFSDFVAAIKFVNAVAAIAEAAQHHPDIDVRWNRVTLAFTTHDAGGLTEKDFALARQCDALAGRVLG